MKFIDNLSDNSILLIPSNLKNKILDYINDSKILKSIKLLTFNDLKNGLMYTYNNESIYYVMNKYKVNYKVAKTYIDNTYYLDNDIYENNKLNNILNIKKELDNNNLLIKDNLFINLLKSKDNLYVYGFTNINKFNSYLLSNASSYINIVMLESSNFDYKHTVYEFNTIEEEITYVGDEILNLINSGVDINKIYISNYSIDYYFTFNRIFNTLKIPFYIKSNTTLYETSIGMYFINNLIDDIELLLNNIKIKFDINNNEYNMKIYNILFSLLNTYYWTTSYTSIKDLIEEEMKQIKIPSPHHDNEVTITNIIDNEFSDDEYVFLIGFNLGSIPKFKKDEDYINDDIKTSLYETSNEYNKLIKSSILKSIKNIKNLIITYKLNSSFESYEPSLLIDNKYLNVESITYNISKYSDEINKIYLSKKIDDLIKFNKSDNELSILYNSYKIPYKEYNNKYNLIDNNSLIKLIDNNINFSYSSITKYYQCPFSYFISNILKISTYEDTLDTFIGSLFHDTLDKCLKDESLDIDKVYYDYVEESKDKMNFTNKDMFFINILNKEVHFIIDTIKEQYTHSMHNYEEHEKNIEFEINRKIKTKLKGFVDKILYYDNKAIIIDYKTGYEVIDEELFEYGIKVQLPIYLYMLKLYNENIDVIGLYIQRIMDLNIPYDPKKDFIEEKKKRLRLNGITFDEISSIKCFDDTYESSSIIHGLGMNKDGAWRSYSKVLPISKRDEMIKNMESIINESIDKVSDGIFDIHPLKINEKNIDACMYCEYKDICYRKFNNFNNVILNRGEEDE